MTEALRAARFPGDESLEPFRAGRALPAPLGTAFARADCVLTAPEARARETAALFGVDSHVEQALREQDPGAWAGKVPADLDPTELGTWLGDPGFAPPGGESVDALLGRVGRWLGDVGEGRTVAVTHPAVTRAVAVRALDLPADRFWRIEARPLSALYLRRDHRGWTVQLR
ncbi:histidine phosphatase family protein [Rhodococcus sp. D2-41]|nr:histidine phosphatase family protein [Rhodococcus sp. D2-41]